MKNAGNIILDAFNAPFEVRSYAIESKVDAYGDNTTFTIIPCDISFESFASEYASGRTFVYRTGNPVMTSENEDENVFVLKAVTRGFMPELKFTYNASKECVNVFDVKTGESLMEKRKKAIAEKIADSEPTNDDQINGISLPDELADPFFTPPSYSE